MTCSESSEELDGCVVDEETESSYDVIEDRDNEPEGTPLARSGHRMVTDGTSIYSVGGFSPKFWHVEQDEGGQLPLFQEVSVRQMHRMLL